MYSYNVSIEDSAPWKEKVNIFKVLVPILNEDVKSTGLINKNEIVELFDLKTREALKEYHEENKRIKDEFLFFEDELFFKSIFNLDSFLNIIDDLVEFKEMKTFVSACEFYTKVIMNKENFPNGKNYENAVNDVYIKFIEQFVELSPLGETNAPSNKNDFYILNNVCKNSTISFANLIGAFKKDENDDNDYGNYSSIISKEFIDVLVNEEIIDFNSFSNMFDNNGVILTELVNHRDLIEYFLDAYIDRKVTLKKQRTDIIKTLEDRKNSTDDFDIFLIDCINNVLLQDKDVTNLIKSEWMGESLNVDTNNDDDDPFNF